MTLSSVHDNSREDRRWELACGAIPGLTFPDDKWISITQESELEEPQEWNGVASNSFLVGFSSEHSNQKEDRTYKFFTARSDNFVLPQCTGWTELNVFDGDIDLQLGDMEVIAAIKSVYNNGNNDRQFSAITCKLAQIV